MHVFLDESGCLGFDFEKQGTSKYFIVTLLVINSRHALIKCRKSVERTIKKKIGKGRKLKSEKADIELKGYKTDIEVKKYFWEQIKDGDFELYTIALEKNTVHHDLRKNTSRLYNYISRLLIEKVDFEVATDFIELVFDKCKSSREIQDFNNYLMFQLSGEIPPHIPLNQQHENSKENKWLQALDLFCWGVYRKYEYDDTEWYDIYKEKIKFEDKYFRFNHKKKKE